MMHLKNLSWQGYLRSDGRKGIRNQVLLVYTVECAHHVVREIAKRFPDDPVQIAGFGGCYPNEYADRMMERVCTHANVGAVVIVSLGCESFNRIRLNQQVEASGRHVFTVHIQGVGGTRSAITEGIKQVAVCLEQIQQVPRVLMRVSDLIIGTVSGGSDATSGITANPAVGVAYDLLNDLGATTIFENTGEMVGLETIMSSRGQTPELQKLLKEAVDKATRYYAIMGHGSFAPGNAEGGLTTQEEKSMGAYVKSGTRNIIGLIKPAEPVGKPGLYLMDIVPDGDPLFGFPNPNDSSEIIELIASGAHLVLFTTGRGSVVGSAISPVIKVCANPITFERMEEDMDLNAGKILTENLTTESIGYEIVEKIIQVASGVPSCSEALGHQEFVLGYKTFTPSGPACLAT
jgi:altronate dehydratase large subunit